MDIEDYRPFDGELLRQKIHSLSRPELDEQIHQFGGQYALLCQRLEALYSPDRLDQFIAVRPGGLQEIDKAIAKVGKDNPKELKLLNDFRELNRILLPFMDDYEARTLAEVEYMSKDELAALAANVNAQLVSAEHQLKQAGDNYRKAQDAAGTVRLGTLMKTKIQDELKKRGGFEAI